MKTKQYRFCKLQKNIDEAFSCSKATGCKRLEAERELAVESLKAHLSEQRHDFFNLLQVLYGYTQLKKTDKVLAHIKDFCRQMENIGRLYNCKCIKLADLLYTKDKEAESIDIDLEISAEVSFDPIIRMLEAESVLNAVNYAISAFLYVLDSAGYKNSHLVFELRENPEDFHMRVYCREISEGQLEAVSLEIPEEEMYWKKLAGKVISFERLVSYCSEKGFEGRMLEAESAFVLSIDKRA